VTTITAAPASAADADLARRIALFLEQRRLTSSNRLTVAADRGVVTLRGTAPTFHQRQLIVSATRRVAGVIQIMDELDVDPPRAVASRSRSIDQRLAVLATTLALIVGLFAAEGCGRSGPPRAATYPTKGSVSYQGRPIGGAFIALHPKNESQPDVPASTAIVQPDGTFAVTTYNSGDGVPEGEYIATFQWRKAVKSGGDYLPGPNLLPAKYSRPETSDVLVRIAAGQNELPPIALKR
jgi:hypothetical protein